MAVGLVIDLDGMTAERYDRLNAEINFPAEPPDGLISHVAAPTAEGFRVVDVWESVDAPRPLCRGTARTGDGARVRGRCRGAGPAGVPHPRRISSLSGSWP
jgi:hypothetical protein